MSLAVSVENLSKKYVLRHATQARYATLREAIPNALKSVGQLFRQGGGTKEAREEFWALRDVNFEVKQGDRVGIIGHNGAGKSTLLKLLSRITDPTEGRICLNGRIASLLEVGTGFNPELTGRENIYLNGAILGMTRRDIHSRFDDIVAFAEVEKFLDTPVKRYSSGMYMRLAFSIAAHVEPDVLIVDEVLAVGDMQFQQRCMNRMKSLESAGRTVLFVSHNMDAMTALCDRAIVLDRGRISFDGSALEGRRAYLALQALRQRSVQENSGRGGTGAVRVQSVNVIWMNGGDAGHIVSGEGLSFEVNYEGSSQFEKDAQLELGIGIDSEEGTRLFTSRSAWESVHYKFGRDGGRLRCDIGTLPLAPGTYLISVALIHHNETLDFVQHCASFEVVDCGGSVYIHREAEFGPLVLPCRFS